MIYFEFGIIYSKDELNILKLAKNILYYNWIFLKIIKSYSKNNVIDKKIKLK